MAAPGENGQILTLGGAPLSLGPQTTCSSARHFRFQVSLAGRFAHLASAPGPRLVWAARLLPALTLLPRCSLQARAALRASFNKPQISIWLALRQSLSLSHSLWLIKLRPASLAQIFTRFELGFFSLNALIKAARQQRWRSSDSGAKAKETPQR